MKNYRTLIVSVVAGVTALSISSCAYDPQYSGGSSSGYGYDRGYDDGYGSGYGYGGSNFTTSIFVSTGNPRWGYDPYARCYYDYHRHSYYDPYLSGYYPVGYRPRYVQGAPHPHGWRQGSRHIQPPSRIRSYNLQNYENRGDRYRSLDRDWSQNVRTSSGNRDSRHDNHRNNDSRFSSGQQNSRNHDNKATQGRRDYDQRATFPITPQVNTPEDDRSSRRFSRENFNQQRNPSNSDESGRRDRPERSGFESRPEMNIPQQVSPEQNFPQPNIPVQVPPELSSPAQMTPDQGSPEINQE